MAPMNWPLRRKPGCRGVPVSNRLKSFSLLATLALGLLLSACQSQKPAPAAPAASQTASSADPWWKHAVIYEIYPRSFQDSNGDGTGDINGITSRLDYLVALGVDALWITPMYPSPQVDFGYDIADYSAIDPQYGTLADFDRLVAEAKKRGLRIVMDLVLNHTSDQHPWFTASRSSRTNPKRDWYIWRDGKGPGRSEEHTSELQSLRHLVCRLLLE